MQSNKYVLDTSYISSLLNRRDTKHEGAKKIAETKLREKNIILPATVILELSLLQTQQSTKTSRLELTKIHKVAREYVYVNQNFLDAFEEFVSKTKLKLKTIDYTVLFCAYSKKATLITFDEKLNKVYKRISKL